MRDFSNTILCMRIHHFYHGQKNCFTISSTNGENEMDLTRDILRIRAIFFC